MFNFFKKKKKKQYLVMSPVIHQNKRRWKVDSFDSKEDAKKALEHLKKEQKIEERYV